MVSQSKTAENRKHARSVFEVVLVGAAVLLLKAHVRIPIPQRGLIGDGLYPLLNEIQFRETAFFTFGAIALFVHYRHGIVWARAVTAGIGFACVNFSVMAADARWQEYDDWAEGIISGRYGPPAQVYAFAIFAMTFGVFLLWRSLRGSMDGPNEACEREA